MISTGAPSFSTSETFAGLIPASLADARAMASTTVANS